MTNKGQGEFADAIEPAGVCHPFHVQVLTDVDMWTDPVCCAMQLVEDEPVIDPFYQCLFPCGGVQVIELFSFLYQFGQTYGLDAQVVLCTIEVHPCLLFVGFYFEQDNVLGGMFAQYGFLQKLKVAVVIITVEELAIILWYGEMPAKDFGVPELEAIKAGEALHFDELGFPAAFAVFAYAKVEDEEMRVIILVSYAVAIGYGAFCPFFELRVEDKVDDAFAGFG